MFVKIEKFFIPLICLAVLVILGFAFRTNPASWFDEGIYHQIAANIAGNGEWGMQLEPGRYSDFALISVGYSVFCPAVIFFKIFGTDIVSLRLVASLFLIAFVIGVYGLTKKMYGPRAALWSTALLALFSPLYGHGKNFLGEVPGLAYLVWSLWFLADLTHAKKPWRSALLAGLLGGLAISSKPIYLLLLGAFGLGFLADWKKYFTKKDGLTQLAGFSVGVIITVSWWVITQFGFSNTSVEAIVAHYRNPNYVTDSQSFVAMNLKRFVTESTPLHFLFLFGLALFWAGLTWYKRERVRLVEIVIIVFSILVTLSYVRTAGWYRYFFPAHALLFIFFYPGLLAVQEVFLKQVKYKNFFIPVIGLGLLMAQTGPLIQERLYYTIDAPTAFESVFLGLPNTASVFFYNLPHLVPRFQGENYYQYIEMNPNLFFGQENIARLQANEFDQVFVPIDIKDLVPTCYFLQKEDRGVAWYSRTTECKIK